MNIARFRFIVNRRAASIIEATSRIESEWVQVVLGIDRNLRGSMVNMRLRGTLALLVIASAVYSQSEYFHVISFFILRSISSVYMQIF